MSATQWYQHRLAKVGLVVAVLVYLAVLVPQAGWLANVGFLVLGAALAVATTALLEYAKRQLERHDLAQALYEELAHQVSRICFDAESPWNLYRASGSAALKPMAALRLLKFVPDHPLIYTSTASRITLLPELATGALIRFYYRLSALRRDIENHAAESQTSDSIVSVSSLQLIARRQIEALGPGLNALDCLAPMVQNTELIEAAALASYDPNQQRQQSGATLRQRIASVLGSAQ